MFANNLKFEGWVSINGRALTEYYHLDGKSYIEGRAGSEYQLNFRNNTFEDVLVVMSVDGLCVLDGKSAGLSSPGFVVKSNDMITVPGWKSTEATNVLSAFRFNSIYSSRAIQSGNAPKNAGVIGWMVFEEHRSMVPSFAISRYPVFNSSVTTAGYAMNALGTGTGQMINANMNEVGFTRANPTSPESIFALYYDSYEGLKKRGVVLQPTGPSLFPLYNTPRSTEGIPPKYRQH